MQFKLFQNPFSSRKEKSLENLEDENQSNSIEIERDGSFVVSGAAHSDFNINSESLTSQSEIDLIDNYRRIAHFPEVSSAIDEIINEVIVVEDDKKVVELNLDLAQVEEGEILTDQMCNIIQDEFDHIIKILKFRKNCYDLFKDWYVDTRLAFIIKFNPNNFKENGIQGLVQLDPRKLRRVKVVDENVDEYSVIEEYFVYLRTTHNSQDGSVLKMDRRQFDSFQKDIIFKVSPASIIFVHSGLIDKSSNMIYGHLHKAAKVANQLELVESALIIHRLQNAHEKQVVYVDTGNLPPAKQQAKIEMVKRQLRKAPSYDSVRGTISDSSRFMSMSESCLLYTSPSPRDKRQSRMPSSA